MQICSEMEISEGELWGMGGKVMENGWTVVGVDNELGDGRGGLEEEEGKELSEEENGEEEFICGCCVTSIL